MDRKGLRRFWEGREVLLLFLIPFFLHAWNIGHDLPGVFNSDEPHHLNVAARFGTGDLNPHDFKYPALWHYALAAALGGLYAAFSLLGLAKSAEDFARQFVQDPTPFYLVARLLAAASASLVGPVFYRLGVRYRDRAFAARLGLLGALSPTFLEFGVNATPYGLTALLIAASLAPLIPVAGAGLRAFALSGLLMGLATSTQYIAAPAAGLLLAAALRRRNPREAAACVAAGLAAMALGFFAGTPFALLDLPSALRYLGAMRANYTSEGYDAGNLGVIAGMTLRFMDPWGVGAALVAAGLIEGWRRKGEALLWLAPLVLTLAVLGTSQHWRVSRFYVAGFVPLYIPAANGLSWLWDACKGAPWARAALMGLILAPFGGYAVWLGASRGLPDTRTQAKEWILEHVPSGESLLLPDPFNGPQLRMCREQVRELWEKASAAGNLRRDVYRLLLRGHPGGGYRVYYLKRSVSEVGDLPGRTEASYQAQDLLDPAAEGLKALTGRGVRYAVIDSSFRNEHHRRWLEELDKAFSVAAVFSPSRRVNGPDLTLYERRTR